MKKFIYIIVLLGITVGLQAKKYPDRPEAQATHSLSVVRNFIRDWGDFWGTESLGFHALSRDNEQFIRDIIIDLNMDDHCIEIRGMTNWAQEVFGRMNTFVMPSLIPKGHAYLYVSEEWLESLSEPERQGLIRHELMHLKLNHYPKQFAFGIAKLIASGLLGTIIYKNIMKGAIAPTDEDHANALGSSVSSAMFFSFFVGLFQLRYSRMCETEADIEAVKSMGSKQGLIDVLTNIKDHIEDPKSKFAFKRFVSSSINWLLTPLRIVGYLFYSQPRLKYRIRDIQALNLNKFKTA